MNFVDEPGSLRRACGADQSQKPGLIRFAVVHHGEARVNTQSLCDAGLIGAQHCRDVLDFVTFVAQKSRGFAFRVVQRLATHVGTVQEHTCFRVAKHGQGITPFLAVGDEGGSTPLIASGVPMVRASGLRKCSGPLTRATTSSSGIAIRFDRVQTPTNCRGAAIHTFPLPAAAFAIFGAATSPVQLAPGPFFAGVG